MSTRKKILLKNKEKKIIATRLMQISLLVDDYLYQSKPITPGCAEAYIKEVLTYKHKCYGDARSLQVIEKLIRCMKGIIYEQQELDGACAAVDFDAPNFQEQPISNVMQSPVYSTTDEYLTQLPDYMDIEEHFTTTNEIYKDTDLTRTRDCNNDVNADKDLNATEAVGMEISTKNIELSNDKAQCTGINNETTDTDDVVTEIIDLCDDEIDEMIQSSYGFNHELNIQNAISNLSIGDIEEVFTAPFSQECSQSILDCFDPKDCYSQTTKVVPVRKDYNHVIRTEMIARKPETKLLTPTDKPAETELPFIHTLDIHKPLHNKTVPLAHDYGDVIKTATIKQTPETKIVSFHDRPPKIVLPVKQKINIQKPLHMNPMNTQTKEKMQNKVNETKSFKTSKPRNKRSVINKNNGLSVTSKTTTNIIKHVINNDSKAKTTKTNPKAQKQMHLQANEKKTQEKVHQAYTTTKLNNMQSTNHQNKAKPLTCPKVQPVTQNMDTHTKNHKCTDLAKVPNIYNNDIVNDLSWIENIRFVREITTEEYECITEKDFWENYTLPGNWSETDFDY